MVGEGKLRPAHERLGDASTGGHFAAVETPQVLADDILDYLRVAFGKGSKGASRRVGSPMDPLTAPAHMQCQASRRCRGLRDRARHGAARPEALCPPTIARCRGGFSAPRSPSVSTAPGRPRSRCRSDMRLHPLAHDLRIHSVLLPYRSPFSADPLDYHSTGHSALASTTIRGGIPGCPSAFPRAGNGRRRVPKSYPMFRRVPADWIRHPAGTPESPSCPRRPDHTWP